MPLTRRGGVSREGAGTTAKLGCRWSLITARCIGAVRLSASAGIEQGGAVAYTAFMPEATVAMVGIPFSCEASGNSGGTRKRSWTLIGTVTPPGEIHPDLELRNHAARIEPYPAAGHLVD